MMWAAHNYLTRLGEFDWPDAVARAAGTLFRVDFSRPGFAQIEFSCPKPAAEFRGFLLRLAGDLSAALQRETGTALEVVSVNCFDQQATTRPHLDGAPVESFLLLGYEPTPVWSRLALLDYARYAHERGLAVQQFLDRFNPWLMPEMSGLDRYFTEVTTFTPSCHQIVLINNSRAEFGAGQQGVMHQADIINPDPNQSRVINSIVLAPPDSAAPPRPTADQIAQFVAVGTPAAG